MLWNAVRKLMKRRSKMDLRELKALEIAAKYRIVFENGAWTVPSQQQNGVYKVKIGDKPSCECEDFQLRQSDCKHIMATKIVCARDHGGNEPVIPVDAVPKKKTYKQNWPKYNLAQTTEKRRFQELLFDLCRNLPSRERKNKRGRPYTPMADMIFAITYKIFSTMSVRRFISDLDDARVKGFTSQPIHYNRICAYLEDEAVTPVLHQLIEQSAMPLKAVEIDFAVDSSGFSTSRFVKWFDHKYGKERQEHDWVKVHICTGVRTNIVTAVTIKDKNAADSPLMPELVNATAKNFKIGEVSGDKGYLSVENVDAIHAVGGTPFIAPKASTSGKAGGLFEKMYHYYQFNREEFLRHYHKRSNVESTFSMIKAKFRDHVRSKTDTAMKNEVLCKILCHNLVVVHQSHIELGIEPVFWAKDEPEKEAKREEMVDILPFARPG